MRRMSHNNGPRDTSKDEDGDEEGGVDEHGEEEGLLALLADVEDAVRVVEVPQQMLLLEEGGGVGDGFFLAHIHLALHHFDHNLFSGISLDE